MNIKSVNLASMPFMSVKILAKEISGKTNETIAEEIRMGHEHVARHFRDPHYNISPAMMPALCKALGNDLQIEWQCIQAGGHFSKVDRSRPADLSLDVQMSKCFKESSDVMEAYASAMLDGHWTAEEIDRADKELLDLIRKATECREALRTHKSGR